MKSYNIEFFYKRTDRKEEWKIGWAAVAFLGLQLAIAAWLFLR